MAKNRSDINGHFLIAGSSNEVSPIEAKVNIYNDCNDEHIHCVIKFSIYVPRDFIFEHQQARRVFDVGVVDLNREHQGESAIGVELDRVTRISGQIRDCIN